MRNIRSFLNQKKIEARAFYDEQVFIGATSFSELKHVGSPVKDAKEIIAVLLFLAFLGPITLDLFFNVSQTNWPSSLATLWTNMPSIAFIGLIFFFLDKTF